MVYISTSNIENVQGVCVHSKNIHFDFEYTSTYSTRGLVPQNYYYEWKDDLSISFYSIESIACKPKSDNFYSNANLGDIRSTAKNKNYKNVTFTTKKQDPGSVTIRQSGEWYAEKICDTCCKEFKQTDLNITHEFIGDGGGSGGTASPDLPNPYYSHPEYSTGGNLQKYLTRSHLYSPAHQRILAQHPIIFSKIFGMIKKQADRFNRSGYLPDKKLETELGESSKSIDNDILNSLNCAGSYQTCLSCDNVSTTQRDPTYKNEDDVILESNYGNTILTSYGPKENLIKLVDLNFSRNSIWVDNI